MKQLWVTPLAQWSPSHIQIHLCKCWQQAIHLSAFLCCFFFFFFFMYFSPPLIWPYYSPMQEHMLHMQALDQRAQETNMENWLNPHCPPRCDRNYGYPVWWWWRQKVTTSLHFHCKTPNAPWMQPSARKKNPHNLNLILSFSEWHRHLEWQTAYQFTADHTSLHF